eukprot:gene15497-biopygen12245
MLPEADREGAPEMQKVRWIHPVASLSSPSARGSAGDAPIRARGVQVLPRPRPDQEAVAGVGDALRSCSRSQTTREWQARAQQRSAEPRCPPPTAITGA